MSQYDELDRRIIAAIEAKRSPLYCTRVNAVARDLEDATGRSDFRIIDGRLQAMRKAGTIRHLTKAESNGQGGWHVIDRAKIKGSE